MRQRKTPRASRFDYRSSGVYFVTICTKDRRHYFGEVVAGEMQLNKIGLYCSEEIERLSERKGVDVHEWIVMPNHVHILLVTYAIPDDGRDDLFRKDGQIAHPDIEQIKDGLTGRPHRCTDYNHTRKVLTGGSVYIHLGQIINILKGNITKFAKLHDIVFARQSRYHDKIVRDQNAYERIKYYIQQNPKNRKKDCFSG